MQLVDYQLELSKQLSSAVSRSACVVVSGRTGFGKRTVAEAVSRELGLKFYSVPIDVSAREVCKILFGHENLANPECSEDALLAEEGVCVFLSGAENIDPPLLPVLREVFRSRVHRSYLTGGVRQVVILSLSTQTPQPRLRETDPLVWSTPCVRFSDRLTSADLFQVAISILSEMGVSGDLKEDDFQNVRLPSEGLCVLRKWLFNSAAGRDRVEIGDLQAAMSADVSLFAEQINYRGKQITQEEYQRWSSQFDVATRPIIDHLIREMVLREYVMSERDFHQTLDSMVLRSGIPKNHQVALCEWQPFGKSGPIMAHRVKERGNWGRGLISLKLDSETAVWSQLVSGKELPVIFVDDFVGSGDSIFKIVPRIRLLLDECPTVWVCIMIVVGFAEGVQRLHPLRQQYGDRVKIVVGRVLYAADTCFHEASELVLPGERQVLGAFCEEFGKKVKNKNPRGYGNLGGLFVFHESIPNTTLPLIWYDAKPDLWRPLLPASMVSDDTDITQLASG